MNATETLTLYPSKDDYGRTCYSNYALKGVVVRLPRTMPDEKRFLVNLHLPFPKAADAGVHYFPKKANAFAFLLANGERR